MSWPLRSSLFAVLLLAACGGDDDGNNPPIDAPAGPDAAPLAASEVSCTGVDSPVITTSGFAFSPAITSVTVDTVVKFTMPAEHNAISNDGLFTADFNGDTCVRFEAPGTYRFRCGPHSFVGTVSVAP